MRQVQACACAVQVVPACVFSRTKIGLGARAALEGCEGHRGDALGSKEEEELLRWMRTRAEVREAKAVAQFRLVCGCANVDLIAQN